MSCDYHVTCFCLVLQLFHMTEEKLKELEYYHDDNAFTQEVRGHMCRLTIHVCTCTEFYGDTLDQHHTRFNLIQ